jgi:hypothetical protein
MYRPPLGESLAGTWAGPKFRDSTRAGSQVAPKDYGQKGVCWQCGSCSHTRRDCSSLSMEVRKYLQEFYDSGEPPHTPGREPPAERE